jgi:hypothetical protein
MVGIIRSWSQSLYQSITIMRTPFSYLAAISLAWIAFLAADARAAASISATTPDIVCHSTQKFSETSTCGKLLAAWSRYRDASSAVEHAAIAIALRDARIFTPRSDSSDVVGPEAMLISADELAAANESWQKWFVVMSNLPKRDQATLADADWRKLLTLAHESPISALKKIEAELARNANDGADGLRLLLAGWLSNNLQTLERLSPAHTEAKTAAKIDAYIASHKQDFLTHETCYGAVYNGQHYKQAEVRFKSNGVAMAAAYLSQELGACGECEGNLDCHLSRGLNPLQTFLGKHSNTIYTREVLLRAKRQIGASFAAREAMADYLTAEAFFYSPRELAQTLVRFEDALRAIEPASMVSLKALLGELYGKLNQPANAQRIREWLALHDPARAASFRIDPSSALQASLPLRMNHPASDSANVIALSWGPRAPFKNTKLRVWRSEDAAFTQPIAIGDVLAADSTASVFDHGAKPNTCYWYRVATADAMATPLSNAAFAQTRPPETNYKSFAETLCPVASANLLVLQREEQERACVIRALQLKQPESVCEREGCSN